MNSHAIFKVDNQFISDLINKSTKRLVYAAPGINLSIAQEIEKAWNRLGINSVNIILDVDAEIFRLGYGEIEALTYLENKAREYGTLISHQPGIRIGLIIADENVIIFTPTPLLIESESRHANHPNAIFLDNLPFNVAKDIGLGPKGVAEQNIGLAKAPSSEIQNVVKELEVNPVMKFNIAKAMTVFNSRFEFVEFELKNAFISRKEVPLKSDLFGLVENEILDENLKGSYKLISKGSGMSEKELVDKKKAISNKYLIQLTGYGVVILRAKKDEFLKEIENLKKDVSNFQKEIEEKLDGEISKNKGNLIKNLLPAVIRNTPDRWFKHISSIEKTNRDNEILELLDSEISTAFQKAKDMIKSNMQISLVFKGITYELLNDDKFMKVAKKAIPSLKSMHWEGKGAMSE